MRRMRAWLVRLIDPFNKRRQEQELADEIETNLALQIEDNIRAIQAQLKGRRVSLASASDQKAPGTKRVLSPPARRRIAAAQRKRWAEHRRRAAQAAKQA